uniref:Uncharacterized protein n=1 Tax=Pipistrellus kuhlii TaxID=59472 RepID=A0A7J7VV40_PIPKU|nr:hypothetical protein mPipKuh1_008250 [Pipistrellus kuhlii]
METGGSIKANCCRQESTGITCSQCERSEHPDHHGHHVAYLAQFPFMPPLAPHQAMTAAAGRARPQKPHPRRLRCFHSLLLLWLTAETVQVQKAQAERSRLKIQSLVINVKTVRLEAPFLITLYLFWAVLFIALDNKQKFILEG